MVQNPAIRFEHVSKTYETAIPSLDDASFAIQPREFVSIVGGSGSGKTTLLQLVNRLSEPTGGAIYVKGDRVADLDPVKLRRGIGYVFQEVGLFTHLSVGDNIGITPKLLHWPPARIAARVDELLDLVRLSREYAARKPGSLSGGQRQRVGVARALAAEPSIMLMDEPFAALDPVTRDALGQDYRAIHDRLGLTTVMVTHDMLEALSLADRIIVLSQGKIIADGTPKALLADDNTSVRELMAMPLKTAERINRLRPSRQGH